jgi:hypothetical protein
MYGRDYKRLSFEPRAASCELRANQASVDLSVIASEAIELRLQPSSGTGSGTGQIIGLDIAFTRHVRDGEPQRANELATDPVK